MGTHFAYVVTINNWTEEDKNAMRSCKTPVLYCCFAEELAPETQTPHLQGLVITTNKLKDRINKAIGNRANLTAMTYGDTESMRMYCKGPYDDGKGKTKPENATFEEHGTFLLIRKESKQGERNDLKRFRDAVQAGAKEKELLEEHDIVLAKYPQYAKKYRMHISHENTKKALAHDSSLSLSSWQITVLQQLESQNNRQITWVWSIAGGRGKSHMARWLIAHKDAILFEGGKKADIACALAETAEKEYVIFDFSRSKNVEELNHMYDIAESMKNGVIFSSKYLSGMHLFKSLKIIIFANFEPDYKKWSADRYDVVNVDV